MVRVGVFGATGYAGYELVQLLRRHPEAQLVFATSEQRAGGRLADVYPCPDDMALLPAGEAPLDEVECVFCSLPHGASMATVQRVWQTDAGTRRPTKHPSCLPRRSMVCPNCTGRGSVRLGS